MVTPKNRSFRSLRSLEGVIAFYNTLLKHPWDRIVNRVTNIVSLHIHFREARVTSVLVPTTGWCHRLRCVGRS